MTKSVYMSYPQLFRLRGLFESVKNLVETNAGFLVKDNIFTVRQEYEEPFIFEGIGKGNNWIALKLVTTQIGENVVQSVPAVSIELSTGNGYQSVLTIDEFLTIYTIIKDLDLTSIQCMCSLAFLDTPGGYNQEPTYNTGYQQPVNPYQHQQPAYNSPYTPTPEKMTAPYITPQQPYYVYNTSVVENNTNGYQQRTQQGSYNKQQYQRKPYQGPQQGYTQPRPSSTVNQFSQMNSTTTPSQEQQTYTSQNQIPPRDERKMSFSTIEDTPVSDFMIDDDSMIDAIFKNVNED